jgi:hypothetical protein
MMPQGLDLRANSREDGLTCEFPTLVSGQGAHFDTAAMAAKLEIVGRDAESLS